MNNEKRILSEKNDPVIANDIASDKRAKEGEGEIKKYNEEFPDHQALEDIEEIQSTDDV